MKFFQSSGLSFWFVLFILFRSGCLSSKGTENCSLCFGESHSFADHLLSDNMETIKLHVTSIDPQQFRDLISEFIRLNVNFVIGQFRYQSIGAQRVLDIFRMLLSTYRVKHNKCLRNIDNLVNNIDDAIMDIASPDVRKSFRDAFYTEFRIAKMTRKRKTLRKYSPSKPYQLDHCLLCLDVVAHDFYCHVRMFRFDDSIKKMTDRYFRLTNSSSDYVVYFIQFIIKFLSLDINSFMAKAAHLLKAKSTLIAIVDQFLEAFIENITCRSFYLKQLQTEITKAVQSIEDHSLRNEILFLINVRLYNFPAHLKNNQNRFTYYSSNTAQQISNVGNPVDNTLIPSVQASNCNDLNASNYSQCLGLSCEQGFDGNFNANLAVQNRISYHEPPKQDPSFKNFHQEEFCVPNSMSYKADGKDLESRPNTKKRKTMPTAFSENVLDSKMQSNTNPEAATIPALTNLDKYNRSIQVQKRNRNLISIENTPYGIQNILNSSSEPRQEEAAKIQSETDQWIEDVLRPAPIEENQCDSDTPPVKHVETWDSSDQTADFPYGLVEEFSSNLPYDNLCDQLLAEEFISPNNNVFDQPSNQNESFKEPAEETNPYTNSQSIGDDEFTQQLFPELPLY